MENNMGILYIVSTPIGNLDDITLRAIETLKSVDVIAAEDTRHTLKLLNRLEISKPLISYHRHNEEVRKNLLIEKLNNGENIALVSDAGTPGISDPGMEVIKSAIDNNIEIVPVPGATAFVPALICSGLNTSEFVFLGFLPLNKKLRKIKLEEIKETNKTIIIYEAPHKLKQTLKDLDEILEERKLCIAREISKIHEEYSRGTIKELIEKFENVKGEIVIVIEGNNNIVKENIFDSMTIEEHYEFYVKKGYERKEIIKMISKDRNLTKNDVYIKFIKK